MNLEGQRLSDSNEQFIFHSWNLVGGGRRGFIFLLPHQPLVLLPLGNPGENGRDPVVIRTATLQPDGKTVVFGVPGLAKAMQFQLKYDMDDAGGELVRGTMAGTINEL